MPSHRPTIVPADLADRSDPLAARIARECVALSAQALSAEVIDKVKLCLMDLIGCACESRALPWSRQAIDIAERVADGGATVIGSPHSASFGDAAFANAVMGHGLVREDMHSGSISHLGIAVLPALLALSQYRRASGREFIAAAVIGYEVGGQVGRAVMDAEIARIHRPTGVTGPVAAASAGARLLGLGAEATTSAIALGANATAGFNQWAHTGGSEMFFHVGFAARNGVTAARLAEAGAFASPSALDGVAGLFAALGKPSAGSRVALFRAAPEILAVYHKPVPACNFAQTPSQSALAIARETSIPTPSIVAITVRVPRAGALYPGCDFGGPFEHILQAKMSIQYNVAAALMLGGVTERNFTLLDDAELRRLIGITKLQIDDAMTRVYPGLQGGEVEVRDCAGATHRVRLENVVNASVADVQARFRLATQEAFGAAQAGAIERAIDELDGSDDAGRLARLLRPEPAAAERARTGR
jgi:2-methylcitrate dehydratase PrpD